MVGEGVAGLDVGLVDGEAVGTGALLKLSSISAYQGAAVLTILRTCWSSDSSLYRLRSIPSPGCGGVFLSKSDSACFYYYTLFWYVKLI